MFMNFQCVVFRFKVSRLNGLRNWGSGFTVYGLWLRVQKRACGG